ncbi:MAG: filamentous hemagglutinin N-terminal domain-containing protein [Opitutus sp.]|nr:filamentous hemagglutinin N-terminal domain-containing protein [Opitutus sp.]MCS6246691.1 filamentous hemagglutinin N-terminal domain-containing protein [Opitutus sp.]MCS6274503.1 filamentous hemagglutinin N-terminal domain-containing protein [Opitutus sp.]MCS6277313.1 filamentous hemagglutinin N-terminal domain-containing protein [Opitutus sp.]MCS6300435.1 filamentous hemagglutinin N-terminal domain-containing protein [Opitutus sp.]
MKHISCLTSTGCGPIKLLGDCLAVVLATLLSVAPVQGQILPIVLAPAPTALPTGANVVSGVASLQQSGANLTITQSSQQLITNWQTFNIGSDASVRFVQPSASSVALNRVQSSDPSAIYGSLSSNGQVFLLNPAGVIFGASARVDVGGLVASSLALSDAGFLAGRHAFEKNAGAAAAWVVNAGQIRTAEGGYVAFLAPRVENQGTISAAQGSVALVAADKVSLNFDGQRLINFTVDQGALDAQVQNSGRLQASGGAVLLSARAADHLTQSVVNQSGVIEASSLTTKGGRIVLEGDAITLSAGSRTEATGPTGGGEVLVGGDWQGGGPLYQATTVKMEAGASIDVSATQAGDGGKVVLWSEVAQSESRTTVQGSIFAKGGPVGGNGGQIETSGYVAEVGGATISASAANGVGGLWLIDPTDATIDQTIANTYVATLNGGTSVLNEVSGNISIDSGVTLAKTVGGDATLTLKATGDIVFNSSVAISSTLGKLNTVLWADSDSNSSGSIRLLNGSSIISNGGDITMGGGANPLSGAAFGDRGVDLDSNVTLTAGAGSVSLRGTSNRSTGDTGIGVRLIDHVVVTGADITVVGTGSANAGSADRNWGVSLEATSSITGTGTVAITGTGGVGSGSSVNGNNNQGIFLDSSSSITASGSGAMTLTGTGGGTGTSTTNFGIYLLGSSVVKTTGAGALSLVGTGGNGTNGLFGVKVNGSTVSAEGVDAGSTVSITGTGGTGQTGSGATHGVSIENSAVVESAGGNVTVTGTGGGNGSGSYNMGVVVQSGGIVRSGGAGTLAIAGTGGSGAGSNQYGVLLSGGNIRSAGGAIGVTGVGGSSGGTDSFGIIAESTSTVGDNSSGAITLHATGASGSSDLNVASTAFGGASYAGNIAINANTFSSYSASTLQTTGGLTIAPRTSFSSTFTWSGSNAGSLTGLTINSLSSLGGLTLGKSGNTADLTIGGASSIAGPINLFGGNIAINAALTATGTNTTTLTATGSINGSGLITSTTVDLNAATGIGNTTALNLAASSISADTTAGKIDLNNALATATTVTSLTSASTTDQGILITFDQTGGGAVNFTNVSTVGSTGGFGDISLSNTGANLTIGTAATTSGDSRIFLTTTTSGNLILTGTTGSASVGDGGLNFTSAGNISGAGLVTGNAINTLLAQTGISLNTAVGDVFQEIVTAAGDITISNTQALQLPAFTAPGNVTLTSTGGVIRQYETFFSIVVAGTTNLTAGANAITLNNATNDFTGAVSLSNSGANNVSLRDTNALDLGTVGVGSGTLTVQSGGALTQSGVITQAASAGAASFTAGANAITLNNASNNFTGTVSLSNSGANNVSLRDTNALDLGTVSVGSGTLTVQSGGALTQSGVITQAASAGVASFTAGAFAITLANASNDFTGALSLSNSGANNVSLRDTNALDLGTVGVGSGTLTVQSGGALTQSGVITQAASAGAASFTAGAFAITLANASNDFTGALSLSNSGANNVSLRDTNALDLGTVSVGSGTLTVQSGGALTQSGGITQAASAGAASFTAGANAITLTNASNDFTGTVSLSNSGANAVALTDANALTLDSFTLGAGTFTATGTSITLSGDITTTGSQTYNGAVLVGGTTVTLAAGSGAISFNNEVNSSASGTHNLVLNSTGLTTLGGAVGTTTALTSLTTNTGGTTALNGGAVTTTGAQTYGDAITLGADTTLTGVGSSFAGTIDGAHTLTISDSGTPSFGGALGGSTALTGLALLGGGNFTLTNTSNRLGILAGNVGSLAVVNAGALTIGTVGATQGITGTGTLTIATLSGDLTVAQAVVTTNTTSGAVVLNAGKSAGAGTAAGGELILTGSPTVSVGTGGRATLFTGSVSGSTGLATLVGSGSGRFRYNSDEVSDGFSTALGAGVFAIYREQPTLSVTASAASKTFDNAAFTGGNGVTNSGFVNGDTASVLTGTVAFGGSSQGAIAVGTYAISPSGLANGLGYAISFVDGTLTVSAQQAATVFEPLPVQPVTPTDTGTGGDLIGSGGALVVPGTPGGPSLISMLPPEAATAPGVEIARSGNVLTLTGAGTPRANGGETVSSSFAVIVLRANQAPAQESSFALTQADDTLQLSPLSGSALQALTEPGKVLASYAFEITDPQLGAMSFSAEVTDTGLVIKVSSGTASELASTQRDLLVGTALLVAQRNKMATAAQVKSVFIDFR